jgi:prevent-host-death family protein
MIRVNIQEAKTHLSRYVERVEQGDVIIVCRHNKPVAELRAVEAARERPARVAGLLKTDEELAEFDGSPVVPGAGQA